MTHHIPNAILDRDLAKQVAADLGCLIGFGASVVAGCSLVTITGKNAHLWQDAYLDAYAAREAET